MPRFFLHIREGATLTEDLEGQVFSNLDAAREEAVGSAIELVVDSLRHQQGLRLERSIKIADECGRVVEEVQFEDAVRPRIIPV